MFLCLGSLLVEPCLPCMVRSKTAAGHVWWQHNTYLWTARYSGAHPTCAAWNQEGLCLHTRTSLMLTGVCLPSALSSIDNAFYLTNNKPSTHKSLQHTTTFHLKTMHLSSTCYKSWECHHNTFTPSLHLYVPQKTAEKPTKLNEDCNMTAGLETKLLLAVVWAAKYSRVPVPQPEIQCLCLQTEFFLMMTGVYLPSTPSSIENAFYLTNNKSSTQRKLPLKGHAPFLYMLQT